MDPRLGRISSPTDYRDHDFLARAVAPPMTKAALEKPRRWFVPDAWDQQQTPECVAFATNLFLNAGPVRNKDATSAGCDTWYQQCKAIDGFPTEDGTTVRASMQVAQQLGYVPEYRWAFTAIDIATWMMSVGPVVLGTDWLLSMFDPIEFKRDAWIDFKTNSPVEGGHSYTGFEINPTKRCPDKSVGAIMIQNSWGKEWANKGRAFMAFTALDALMSQRGEAACAREILKPAA
jgi:hypothetical protein